MIPQETVQQILDTAQIADVVSDFVTLKRRGASYVACCPFHNEKTPSFYVTPSKGIYKCFGCGKAGTAVGFVMEHEHCSYVEALHYLAKKYHIEIVEEDLTPEEITRRQRSESLLLVSEFAQKFFASQLQGGEGRDVGLAYYRSRALEDETIARFGLGWAPSAKTALLDAARSAGYKDEYLLEAGLIVQREDGSLADKFRERVMFPIHSVSGRVIAFSGRALRSDNPAKYLNSPDTPIYTKSNILFGIWFAKGAIAKKDKCIVVEGNVDLVMLHQLGMENVVAPCGTSFTEPQVRLIHKFTDNVTLMFDGDSAGVHAAQRAIPMVLDEGMNVKIVQLPPQDDPDSFARTHSLEEYERYIEEHEQGFLDFLSATVLGSGINDPLKRAGFIHEIADTIAHIPDPIKRSVFVQSAAEKFQIEEDIVSREVQKRRGKLLEDSKREKLRQERASSAAPDYLPDAPPEPDFGDLPPQEEQGSAPAPENHILDPSEREILSLLLRHGTAPLEFESDSPMNTGESVTVTDFISAYLEHQGIEFSNPAYNAVLQAYYEGYDAGLDKQQIINSLLNSPKREIAQIAADLSFDKYHLSVSNLESSMTATGSWLVKAVPKAMFTYTFKRFDAQMDELRRSIPSLSGEPLMEALSRMKELRMKQKAFKENTLDKER